MKRAAGAVPGTNSSTVHSDKMTDKYLRCSRCKACISSSSYTLVRCCASALVITSPVTVQKGYCLISACVTVLESQVRLNSLSHIPMYSITKERALACCFASRHQPLGPMYRRLCHGITWHSKLYLATVNAESDPVTKCRTLTLSLGLAVANFVGRARLREACAQPQALLLCDHQPYCRVCASWPADLLRPPRQAWRVVFGRSLAKSLRIN